ncbi:phosphatase PAP2 family protein [Roseateles sp. LYH14W]|uniref:Phosphatase PAP2 family protein n=1 Tax=Pelomonas parva TaxID=3299032 RepID=A0ABW7F1Z6_9BURK
MKLKPFPAEDWTPVFREYIGKELKYLPPDWLDKKLIEILPPDESTLKAQCAKVIAAKGERQMRLHGILGQVEGLHLGLMALVRARRPVALDTPITFRLLNAANDELLPVLFYFKTEFNAARPSAYIKDLNPMFARPDPNYPGHPTYPSGHAAQSRLFALVLGAMFSKLGADLITLANDVAYNREVAGVHFEADSEAGQDLAAKVFKLLMSNPKFACMVSLAQAEWPENKDLR